METLEKRVVEPQSENGRLRNENAELRANVNKNSTNSHKPPSSDPPFKRPPPKKKGGAEAAPFGELQREPAVHLRVGERGRRGEGALRAKRGEELHRSAGRAGVGSGQCQGGEQHGVPVRTPG